MNRSAGGKVLRARKKKYPILCESTTGYTFTAVCDLLLPLVEETNSF